MNAHDRHLAAFRMEEAEVYCANPACGNSEGLDVMWFSEYGQSWIEPEDCPACHGELLDEKAVEA